MSDTSILPAADTGAALPGAPVPGFEEDGGGDDRRRLLIIGGIVGVVLIAVVAFLLLHGGGSPSSDSGLVPHGTPNATAPSPQASTGNGATGGNGAKGAANGGSKAGTTLPKKTHTQLARDPFKPLVSAADAAGGSGTATSTTGGDTTSVSPGPGAAPGTVPTSPAQGGAPDASVGPPVSIRLLAVHTDQSAVFEVNYRHGKSFRFDVVAPAADSKSGTQFAQDFSLLGIQGNEVTIQIGDDTPFDLRRGTTHVV